MRFIQIKHNPVPVNLAKKAENKAPVIMQILIFIGLYFLTSLFMRIPHLLTNIAPNPYPYVRIGFNGAGVVLAHAGIVAMFILYALYVEKRPLGSLGIIKCGAVVSYLRGLGIGALMITAALLIATAAGGVLIKGVNIDFSPVMFIELFFLSLFNIREEVIFRGWFLTTLSTRTRLWWAVLISAAVFGLIHTGNPNVNMLGIINLMIFGIFTSLYFLRSGNIWGVMAFHSIWNFMQSNVFRLQMSGLRPSQYALFDTVSTTNLFTGGSFGLEGGLAVTIVLAAACFIILSLPDKKGLVV